MLMLPGGFVRYGRFFIIAEGDDSSLSVLTKRAIKVQPMQSGKIQQKNSQLARPNRVISGNLEICGKLSLDKF